MLVGLVNGLWASFIGTISYLIGYVAFFSAGESKQIVSLLDPSMIGIFIGRTISYFFMAFLGVTVAVLMRSTTSVALTLVFLLFIIPVFSGIFISTTPLISAIIEWFPIGITNQITEPWIYSIAERKSIIIGYMRMCIWLCVCAFFVVRKLTAKDVLP